MANVIVSFFQENALTNGLIGFYGAFVQELSKTNNLLVCAQNFGWNSDCDQVKGEALEKCLAFKPDLIISFNNVFCDVGEKFQCPILVYGADTSLYYSNKKQLLENPDKYKYATLSETGYNCLMDMFNPSPKNVAIIPLFTSVLAKPCEQDLNISFIGSDFAHNINANSPFSNFMKSSPTQEEVLEFKNCIKHFLENPLMDFNEYKLKYSFLSQNVLASFTPDLISFYSATKRIQTLSQLTDLGLDVFGPTTWGTSPFWEHEINLSYNSKKVWTLQENEDVYNRSKISLNISHMQAVNGFSWRVCDILASNACLVSEYKPVLKEKFPKVNLLTFTNRYEARELCVKLLNNQSMREDIVLASQEVINDKFRFKNILPLLEQLTGVDLSSNVNMGTSYEELFLENPQKEKNTNFKNKCKLLLYSSCFAAIQIPPLCFINDRGLMRELFNRIRSLASTTRF